MGINFTINRKIKNKPKEFPPNTQSSWEMSGNTLEDLRKAVEEGCAFMPSVMSSSSRSNKAFSYTDLTVLDVDKDVSITDFLSSKYAQYASYLYTTPSHGKPDKNTGEPVDRFRIVFRLPERIDDADLAKAINKYLIDEVGSDPATKDVCRLFYGSSEGKCMLFEPSRQLPDSILVECKRRKEKTKTNIHYDPATQNFTDLDIQKARYAFQEIIEPTAEGERALFIDWSSAVKGWGNLLFDDWAAWASKGHHGQDGNSYRIENTDWLSEQRWDAHANTLWKLLNEHYPGWANTLPPELKGSYQIGAVGECFAGHAQFAYMDDDEIVEDDYVATSAVATQDLFATNTEEEQVAESRTEIRMNAVLTESENREGGSGRSGGQAGQGRDAGPEEILSNLRAVYPNIRLNLMTKELECGPKNTPYTGVDFSTAYVRISRRLGKMVAKTFVFDLAAVEGEHNQYHPVEEFLNSLGDKEPCPYFDRLATELLGLQDDEVQNPKLGDRRLADVILERFLIGAVARVLKPGCRHDWMPVLIGGQNAGKSTFFQYLTPNSAAEPDRYPWVSTMQQGIEYLKERPHALHAGWIVVLDEFERYTKRKYTEELKNIVSVSVDRSARKYENEKSFPRAFVLAGATNSPDFLCDPTGNRRFMPILVQGKIKDPISGQQIIDLDRLVRDRDSIWKAAYNAYMDGKSHLFTSGELTQVKDYVDAFTKDSPIDEKLKNGTLKWDFSHDLPTNAANFRYTTLTEIFDTLQIPIHQQGSMTGTITDALKRWGWESKRITINSTKKRVWVISKELF